MAKSHIFSNSKYFSYYRNNIKNRNKSKSTRPALVFYDHACPICRGEMLRLKSRDVSDNLKLIDISAVNFNAEDWGVTQQTFSAAMHVLSDRGEWLVGMAAIRHVYSQVGLGWLMAPTAWPFVSSVADYIYRHFAPNRQAISRWLGVNSQQAACSATVCLPDMQNKQGGDV